MKLRDVAQSVGFTNVGCGDNSCMWGSPGGMGTNGGCRCVGQKGKGDDRLQLFMLKSVAQHLLGLVNTMALAVKKSEETQEETE